MGVVRMEYLFGSKPLPTPDQVAEKLAEVSGLTIDVDKGSEDCEVTIVELNVEMFLWETDAGSLAFHTGLVRNHYFEVQIDKVMALLGGHSSVASVAHLENPELLRPWNELSPKEQRNIIKGPSWFRKLLVRNQ